MCCSLVVMWNCWELICVCVCLIMSLLGMLVLRFVLRVRVSIW